MKLRQQLTAAALGMTLATALFAAPSVSLAARSRGQRPNFLERHPVMTGVGAAAIAHHTGKNRLRHGRRRNFAQRHPFLTGVAAGGVAHHMAKKHR